MTDLDPYKVLGVSSDASKDEIKKAYRKLARQYHPDTTQGDKAKEDRFKEITAAHEILADDERRAQYDAMSRGGYGYDTHASAGGFGSIQDMLEQMFGGSVGGPAGGRNVRYEFRSGGGGGSGGSPFSSFSFGGPFAGGDIFGGQEPPRRTTVSKKKPAPKKIKASDGSLLRRSGLNVASDLRINFIEAIEGVTKEVSTLTGTSKVKVPAGTPSGKKLRLRGKGLRKGAKSGDHTITIHIDVPKRIDATSRKHLAALKKSLKEKS